MADGKRAEDWVNPRKIQLPRGGQATFTVNANQVAAQQEGYETRIKVQVGHINSLLGQIAAKDAEIMAQEGELAILRQRVTHLEGMLAQRHPSGVASVDFVPSQADPDPAENAERFDLAELANPTERTQAPAFNLAPLPDDEERPGTSL